jgi:succinate dehydrogenase/fumarate reductase flavoprotein subunit
MFESTAQTMKDYDDVFRTKGELKKALREVKELQTATEAEISAK